jgi:hypothetical protein
LKNSRFLLLNQPFWSDSIGEAEMARACGTMGVRDIRTGFWWGNLKGEEGCGEICIAGSIILK